MYGSAVDPFLTVRAGALTMDAMKVFKGLKCSIGANFVLVSSIEAAAIEPGVSTPTSDHCIKSPKTCSTYNIHPASPRRIDAQSLAVRNSNRAVPLHAPLCGACTRCVLSMFAEDLYEVTFESSVTTTPYGVE